MEDMLHMQRIRQLASVCVKVCVLVCVCETLNNVIRP